MYNTVSPADAVAGIQSSQNVFVHSIAATPFTLIKALVERADELENVTLHHLHVEGDAPYARSEYTKSFRVNNLFTGANTRHAVQEGRADYVPVFLSEIPYLFESRIIPLDVALLQVSPPDVHGYCSLGTSVDASMAAAKAAKTVIVEINPQMPRVHGDGFLHVSDFDKIIETNHPLPAHPPRTPNAIETRIGQYVATLVEDRSTLQMGIGAIPDAALAAMTNHKDLGVHTEMFSDGLLPLIDKGVITNKYKIKHRGRIVSSFVMGSQKLYDFIDDNPLVRLLACDYVNDTTVIRQNPNVIAINSAIEVDLTGQVCADSIGTKIYSGVGGQMDFMRGASLSKGGKPIIALPSVTSKGLSRISTTLRPGAGVVTTRAHVQWVVTEYGIAELYGQNLRTRAKRLIEIAHPDHRETLAREARDILKLGV
ncbi:acetyl-CoA hydrolase/transferase family protein [Microscilla marina]|uniref:4-hydroxybutyrate CoA transferase n=1 Tax=Microscilla marina ATCC 23134 TaxID=313606 RepID=A1ZWE1_MICM2|nr:acetyl-CoA hydrolase/transferase C-terminal domain-containing protein [Microscilla marina]EAY25281.1 4-hydroxybutyrate CoA transferase [Microscilla marina ATCC 23134]